MPRKNKPHPIDTLVGQRLRSRRLAQGISQMDLGEAVGTTYQQVQKYESGKNRISASRLYEIAEALDVSISFFFDGAPKLKK